MIKKLSFLVVFLLSVYAVAYADEQKKVAFDARDRQGKMLELEHCRIWVELAEVKDNGDASVSIEIEIIDTSKSLYLFHAAYPEKALKKKKKIKYDKNFPGTKGERVIDSCYGLRNDISLAAAGEAMVLLLSCQDGATTSYRLPLYFVETKEKNFILFKKRQWILSDKNVVELEIEVDIKASAAYYAVVDSCDKMVQEYDALQFCTNKKHKPSLEEQKEPFQSKIDALVGLIDSRLDSLYSSDKRYKLYEAQKKRLTSLDLSEKEGDCGGHPVHACTYCRYTPQQVYRKLDEIYQRIYVSSDRSAMKTPQLRVVNAVYNCPNARGKWEKSIYKDRITRCYNRINQL